LKKHNLPFESFIGGWYIDNQLCDHIVSDFNKNINNAYQNNSEYKKCLELSMHPNNCIPYRTQLFDCLVDYQNKYNLNDNLYRFEIEENINVQYYKPNEGYYQDHFENCGKPDKTSLRCLVFMTYLNDVKNGGTIFKFQNITTPAKKGLTLIWPAYFTHTHKGQISTTNEKYIITGWYSHERNN